MRVVPDGELVAGAGTANDFYALLPRSAQLSDPAVHSPVVLGVRRQRLEGAQLALFVPLVFAILAGLLLVVIGPHIQQRLTGLGGVVIGSGAVLLLARTMGMFDER
jgi:hypothetical protein